LKATANADPLVAIEGLRINYGATEALRGVSLDLLPGHVVAVVGPNGAGKTTFFRALFGELPRRGGTVRVCGLDPFRPEDRRRLWSVARWVPDTPLLYEELTVFEFLEFIALSYGVPRGMIAALVADLAINLGLADALKQRIKTLSFGNQRKVHIAAGFFSGPSGPRVLVLDEPYIGLDPSARLLLSQVIRQYVNSGGVLSERAVLISSHSLAELSAVADFAVMIAAGRVVASGPIRELAAGSDTDLGYELTLFDENAAELARALEGRFEISCRVVHARSLALACADPSAVQQVLRFVSEPRSPFRLRELKEELTSLERVFLEGMEKAE
jgi:ABC-2 type transport system ATP-binding protein